MKKFICFGLCLVSLIGLGQSALPLEDKLTAEVHGDTVILRDDTANRNCGAVYEMYVTTLTGNTLKWLQKDVGAWAYCYCDFNLSVTVDSLRPGHYSVNVYYTQAGSTLPYYVGSVTFEIVDPNTYPTYQAKDGYQSSCLVTGNGEIKPQEPISLDAYPNPTDGLLTISTNLPGVKTITISDMTGRQVLGIVTGKNETTLNLRHLAKQMYLVTVQIGEQTLRTRICKN